MATHSCLLRRLLAMSSEPDMFNVPAVLQANIKVRGSNGRHQMLKLWLPGLIQLTGDHSKTTVVKETNINELLDQQTGLRMLPNKPFA